MNFIKHTLLTAVILMITTVSYSQARIQIIHNSADAALEIVDVWLNETLLIDNFKFRMSTPFTDAPAGVDFTISVSPADSQNPDNPIWSGSFTLIDEETYVFIAEGIISTTGYDPMIPFDITVYAGAKENPGAPDVTEVLSHHGSTDCPVIDIFESEIGLGQFVDDLAYTEFDGYDVFPADNYVFQVRDETGTQIIASYTAPFQVMIFKGRAITMIASGFLHPENNSNGPGFGLWVAMSAGGSLIELTEYDPKALVQVIHNSADTAASVVDVWLNQTLLLDNFAFRTASEFTEIPAEQDITLAIKGPDSQNPDNPLWSKTVNLTLGETYVMVAEGIISESGYDPATPFDLSLYPQARLASNLPSKTDMLIHHGSTDAPVVDFYETGVGLGLLVDDLEYAEFSNYLELQPVDYILEVRDQTGTTKIAAYKASLETLGMQSKAVTVVASGFLDPVNNSNGPEFSLWMATAEGGNLIELPVYDPKSRVQLIHNSADAALEVVDIWLNNELILDNFTFRTASPFLNVPAGQEFTIAVKGPDSQNPADPIWSHTYTLVEDDSYILIADGIISDSGYEPATPFSVEVFTNAREDANFSGQTDMLMHHGSTDTPVIDIVEVGIGLGLMIDNLSYSQFAGYFGLATVNYIFQIRDENSLAKIAAYSAPFGEMGLDGEAVTILASGFLDPENNSDGPAFGLFMARTEGGPLEKLPEYAPKARLQFIHNSADTLVGVADIWVNQTLIMDNAPFRSASAFIDVPAKEQVTISIKKPNSQDPYGGLYMKNFTLTEGETYIMVAEGIISQSGFEPPVPFDIALYTGARETANISGRTDILVHPGSTDAPTIDVIEIGLGAGTLISDLEYAEYSSYLELPTIDYILEIRDAANDELLGTYRASLETLGLMNQAITIVASGFIDPSVNSDGAIFGLWAAVPAGGPMIEMQVYIPSARVQFIHNSADALLSVVDIWLNETLLLDDFMFRSATPFEYIPSATSITLSVTARDAQSPASPLWSNSFTLTTDERYILIANGILSPEGYDPGQPFNIILYTGAVEDAPVVTSTNVLVFHGTTDAPTFDLAISGGANVVENLSYGSFDGYTELPASNYSMDLTAEDGSNLMGNFLVPLADLGLGEQALTILASGFVSPLNNSNGPVMGLLAVETDGTATLLSNTLGIEESALVSSSLNIYPNPASELLQVSYSLKEKANVRMEMMDMTGRVIKSTDAGILNAGVYHEKIDVRDLNSGIYMLKIMAGEGQVSRKILVR